MTTNRFIQFCSLNTSTSKYARVSHFLTVTGNKYTHLVITDATILGFATTFTWLAFGDFLSTFFRV